MLSTKTAGTKDMRGESRTVTVSIFGRDYNVRAGSDPEYVKTLAAHVDSVMRGISEKIEYLSSDRVAILAALNLADEMYQEREKFEEFARGLAQKLESALGAEDQEPESEAEFKPETS